jgi:glutathionyl-hydroquinone reductase
MADLEPEEKRLLVCHVLHVITDRVRDSKYEARFLQDFKALLGEDYGELFAVLDNLEKAVDSLKLKYRCGD